MSNDSIIIENTDFLKTSTAPHFLTATIRYQASHTGENPFFSSTVRFPSAGQYKILFSTSAYIFGTIKSEVSIGVYFENQFTSASTLWFKDGYVHSSLVPSAGVINVVEDNLVLAFDVVGLNSNSAVDNKDMFTLTIEKLN